MKKEKYLIITIIVLSTILLGTTGYIVYDKFINPPIQTCPDCVVDEEYNEPVVCPKCDDVQGVILNRNESALNYQYYFSANNKNYNEYSLILTSKKDSPNNGFFSITLHHGLETDIASGYFKIENGKIRFSDKNEDLKRAFAAFFGITVEELQYEENYYYVDFTYTNNSILNKNREFKLVTNMGM